MVLSLTPYLIEPDAVSQFYKVAIIPKSIQLWHFLHGYWTRIGIVNYDKPLKIGKAGDLHWYGVTVNYKKAESSLRVELSNKRWASFEMKDFFPLVGSHVGLGSWGGAVWFKKTKFVD